MVFCGGHKTWKRKITQFVTGYGANNNSLQGDSIDLKWNVIYNLYSLLRVLSSIFFDPNWYYVYCGLILYRSSILQFYSLSNIISLNQWYFLCTYSMTILIYSFLIHRVNNISCCSNVLVPKTAKTCKHKKYFIKELCVGRLMLCSDQVSPISWSPRLRRLNWDWGQMGCINVRFGGKFTTFSPRRLSDTGSKLRSNLAAAPELFRRILRAGWLIKWQIARPSFTTTYRNDERRVLIIRWKNKFACRFGETDT